MDATLASIVAAATPLIFAVIGETVTERSGVINLSLEGSLMLSALAGFAAGYETGQWWVGFVAAAIVGGAVAALVAWASIGLRVNQVAVGFVLALLCIELSSFLGVSFVGQPGAAVPHWEIPLLSDIPWLGTVFFSHNVVVYAGLALIAISTWYMFRTGPGLVLRGVGERPEAAHARAVAVNRLRYRYALIGGALVGIGGAAFSLDVKLGWSFRHTAGFGWIALAIVIFGGWHPLRAAFGAYLFGALQVVALKLQPTFPGLSQILPLLPFPLMIFMLVLVNRSWFRNLADRFPSWRAVLATDAPAALGRPFEP